MAPPLARPSHPHTRPPTHPPTHHHHHPNVAADWCTYRLEDWWHYEVCYKKHVRQFHKEGNRVVAEYRLGAYSSEATDMNTVQLDASGVSGGVKFVAQQYIQGEPCELTGQPRSAEVGGEGRGQREGRGGGAEQSSAVARGERLPAGLVNQVWGAAACGWP